MYGRFIFTCILIIMLVASLEFAATFEADLRNHGKVQTLQSSQPFKMEPEKDCKGEWIRINRPRSKPPECVHKCRGCQPCIAVQKPERRLRRGRLGVEYANYEPEGWVCKCASYFFIP